MNTVTLTNTDPHATIFTLQKHEYGSFEKHFEYFGGTLFTLVEFFAVFKTFNIVRHGI